MCFLFVPQTLPIPNWQLVSENTAFFQFNNFIHIYLGDAALFVSCIYIGLGDANALRYSNAEDNINIIRDP